ncbi:MULTISPECIES: hypothetical protein [unclassified Mesorhizobium]|uniref:hypothetical protein n=1 Tax=unclassified Mesorhizobium TaxID=325217 RepID=UPI00333CAC98
MAARVVSAPPGYLSRHSAIDAASEYPIPPGLVVGSYPKGFGRSGSQQMTRPQEGFQRIAIAIPETMERRIADACTRDNIDRGDWLRLALLEKLNRSEGGPR